MPQQTDLDLILQQTVQARATEEPLEGGGRVDVFSWLNRVGGLVAPWWSRTRDRQLRSFWKQNDALASAMYTLQEKITSVPFHVEPVDPSVRSHIRQAEEYEANLWDMTGFGAGWVQGVKPVVEDLFGQDNGAFFEVIADGPKDGPIRGAALGLAHMDARCCVRTRSPEYPVYYYDPVDGGRYKFHHTRVIQAAQMPSPDVWMNGVGYCAVSRAINAAQNLYDIATYKMEKLGSRPKRQLLIAKKGLTTNDVILAMRTADEAMDNEGLTRASKTVVIGPARATANTEIDLAQIDLASVPDGFNEQESVTLGVYLLAWAFGVDAREFWPATSVGATKADAMVQHMKARGKAVGNTFALLEKLINRQFLPPYLKMKFDVQDDDEDQQRAAIEETRSATIDRDVKGKVYDVRTARRKLVDEGHLSEESYAELELADGRLEGGEDVLSLFYSEDPLVKDLLDLGVEDPLDRSACEWGSAGGDAQQAVVVPQEAGVMEKSVPDNCDYAEAVSGPPATIRLPQQRFMFVMPRPPAPQVVVKEVGGQQQPVVVNVSPTPVQVVNRYTPPPVNVTVGPPVVNVPAQPVDLTVELKPPQRQVSRVIYNPDGTIAGLEKTFELGG